jgi:hypothetical protein
MIAAPALAEEHKGPAPAVRAAPAGHPGPPAGAGHPAPPAGGGHPGAPGVRADVHVDAHVDGGRPGEHFDGRPGPGGHFDGGHGGGGVRYAFHGRDVRHFNEHDRAAWQGGSWHHEYHNGRYGYWWFAGGSWYFYDQPVYPYPVVVSEDVYVDPGYEDPGPQQPVYVQDSGPPPPPPQQVAPPPGYWYYCDNPPGYYPYIANCGTPFRLVPAQP